MWCKLILIYSYLNDLYIFGVLYFYVNKFVCCEKLGYVENDR